MSTKENFLTLRNIIEKKERRYGRWGEGERQRGNNYFILTLRPALRDLWIDPRRFVPSVRRENGAKGAPAAHLPVSYLSPSPGDHADLPDRDKWSYHDRPL